MDKTINRIIERLEKLVSESRYLAIETEALEMRVAGENGDLDFPSAWGFMARTISR